MRRRTGIFLTADRRKAAGKPGRFVFLRRLSGIVPAQAQRQYCLFGEPAAARRHWYPDSGRVRRIPVPAAVYDRKRRQVLPAGWTSAGNIPSGRTPLPFWLCDADTILGKAGTKIRAHEFHYADSTENGSAFLAQRPNGRTWQAVQTKAQIIAGFPHLYFPSNPEVPQHFADACKAYRKERLSC